MKWNADEQVERGFDHETNEDIVMVYLDKGRDSRYVEFRFTSAVSTTEFCSALRDANIETWN